MTAIGADRWLSVATRDDLPRNGSLVVRAEGHSIGLFDVEGCVYAIDNRCPHMGFPLDRGSVHDCILTCHWHHARFDLASGGTFDPWADDVRAFPARVEAGQIWVDVAPRGDMRAQQLARLRDGLERDLSLLIGKSVVRLLDTGEPPADAFRIGLEFGTTERRAGWGQGLTMLTCLMNLVPGLEHDDRSRALYHGLSAVARDTAGSAPRIPLDPLPDTITEFATLKRWFRRFIEVRDADGAERCVVTAIKGGANHVQMADMLFAAATDHRYIQIGHVLDFTNKAFEALDTAGWDNAEAALTSLMSGYASAGRMEESNAWRNPIDLVALLEETFDTLPAVVREGRARDGAWSDRAALVQALLNDDPRASVGAMVTALRDGCSSEALAGTVAYAAALRIARFHTSNEFGDWDTSLHTFTFANAVHQGMRRCGSVELLRGVFDAAMSLYLDRFLNIPAARIPERGAVRHDPDTVLAELPELLNRQQQVNEMGDRVAAYLYGGGSADRLIASLGGLLLREDRDFHTIQCVEAALRQYGLNRENDAGVHILVAAGRYLGAHSPTVRAQGQTYRIAHRLQRGEHLFEE